MSRQVRDELQQCRETSRLITGLVGYLFRDINWVKRGLLILAGVGLLIPAQGLYATFGLISDIGGVLLGVVVLLTELVPRRLPGFRQS